ncbi:hypothetical protein M3181_17035 [Mesobacillus maritimus]|uniref:hypothetical protein n=1 Tax=Mesobacillus maritimus TaxID=1643336 RepID=UPI002040D3BB|nr:hypothetical protein [Mesobacillus maritimus]MCM3670671.1 hypothetical protein [Mesobacillus maritimus]
MVRAGMPVGNVGQNEAISDRLVNSGKIRGSDMGLLFKGQFSIFSLIGFALLVTSDSAK